jgi:class 3 adenylate cyclase
MALFGAPIAHEDHAPRACYAALHLLERLREFTRMIRREQGLDFATRMGLNSGEVIPSSSNGAIVHSRPVRRRVSRPDLHIDEAAASCNSR